MVIAMMASSGASRSVDVTETGGGHRRPEVRYGQRRHLRDGEGATAGKARWNCTSFKGWQQSVPTNMLPPLITETRKRKGLSPEPPTPAEFIDRE